MGPLQPPEPLTVIGIGASAGGIKALKEFFTAVAPDSGAAYVVILHLSPDYESRLAEVLQVSASIPVTQVRARTTIEANHVYVVPQNGSLSIRDGHLLVTELGRPEERRSPVDAFFRALADSYGMRSVAVVLSGTGSNGSAGLKRVKEYGGLAIAQDPNEAEYGDMPRNSIATGLIDFVLPVVEIPQRVASYRQRQEVPQVTDVIGVEPGSSEALRDVLSLIRVRTGHDFSNYKPATLLRRIDRRLNIRGVESLTGYARLMREQPDEAVALMKELLISVTNFFRDPEAWTALNERVIPRLFDDRRNVDQVRVWVAGCATGEEAYSMAMLLSEYALTMATPPAIQVFGTDLDEHAVSVAREGFYTEAEVADVPEHRLQRFFVREPTGYRVRRELRELVLFAHHNVIKDPPFSHLDLVSCRNLLIYLNRTIQERVIETFHFALRPGSYLFLGTSESPDGVNDLFVAIDKIAHIYESRTVTSRLALPLAESTIPETPRIAPRAQGTRVGERVFPADLHLRLLEQYSPPSVIVNEDHNIVHISESAARFLKIGGGEPSRDILKLVHEDLRVDLRTALHQAAQQRSAVDVRGIVITVDRDEIRLDLAVRPVLRDGDPARGFFLVQFKESIDAAIEPAVQLTSPAEPAARHLEEELSRVKTQLRATVEQYETHAEEAKAANEELQAMNEELRSAAEELETSKEELQSVNEELTTVNQELKIKIEELGLTNNDFQNLINSTDIGTIFLDRGLRVKLTTPRASEVFNLLRSDIGRPLSDITSKLLYGGLDEDVAQVLQRLQTLEREVQARDGRWYLMRLLPYRTTDDRIDGVVITFQDISSRRRAEMQVRGSEQRLRLLIDGALDYAIFTMTSEGRVDSWNPGAERMFGYSAAEMIGKSGAVLFAPDDRKAGVFELELRTARDHGRAEDERYHMHKNGRRFYCSGVTTRLGDADELGFVKIARDLTRQRESEVALQQAHDLLEQHVQERTHQLQEEVRQRDNAREEITQLLRKVVTAQEDERARIARDLHDQLGQQLTAVRIALERHLATAPDGTHDELQAALATARKIDSEVDFLTWELRPATLDDLGLAAALPRYVREWSERNGIAAEYGGSGTASGSLSRDAEVTYYRVAQEALNNVLKHAHAASVDVQLETRDGSVVLIIEDDGIGFDPTDKRQSLKGVGLAGMRERAALVGATLDIESASGSGTTIFLSCPAAPKDGTTGT